MKLYVILALLLTGCGGPSFEPCGTHRGDACDRTPCCDPHAYLVCAGYPQTCQAQNYMKSCITSADCFTSAAELVCSRANQCIYAEQLINGEPCVSDNQCKSGACNGAWCTKPCLTNADCGASNACVPTQNGNPQCFPACNPQIGCRLYLGGQFACVEVQTVDGSNQTVCSL